jgi:hypothetical protein
METQAKPRASLLLIVSYALLVAACAGGYLFWLYAPGRILWNPDFLAFTQGEYPTPFFLPLYKAMVDALGGGIAAGRMLSGLGLVLAFAALLCLPFQRGRFALLPTAATIALLLSSPHLFTTALSPSLDMLFTGAALMALACLIVLTENRNSFLAGILLLLSLLLTMSLRLYAVIFVLASLLIYGLGSKSMRIRVMFVVITVLFSAYCLMAFRVNHADRQKVWCGLEFRYHRLAECGVLTGEPKGGDVNGYVWDEYATLAETAGSHSLRDYYTVGEIVRHCADNYYHYLRRPLVLSGLLLFLLGGAAVWRKSRYFLPALFVVAYPLLLSPAYYVGRASLLNELVGLYLFIALLTGAFADTPTAKRRWIYAVSAVCVAATLALSLPRLSYEMQQWHRQLVEASAVEEMMARGDIPPEEVWTQDTSVTIRYRNPQLRLTPRAYHSWLDFSGAVDARTEPVIPPEELLAGKTVKLKLLLVRERELTEQLVLTGKWEASSVDSDRLYLLTLTQRLGNQVGGDALGAGKRAGGE